MTQKHRRALGEVIVNQLGPGSTAKPVSDINFDIHPIKPKNDVKPDIHSVKRELNVSNAQAPRKGATKKGSLKILESDSRIKDTDITNRGTEVEAAEEGGDEVKRVKPKKSVSFAPCKSFSTSRPGLEACS